MVTLGLILGCVDGTIDLGEAGNGGGPVDDTGSPATDDTGAPGPDDSGPDDTGEPEDPPPGADRSTFTGSERFTHDVWGWTCDETVGASGERVPEGSGNWSLLTAACVDCDDFYEVRFDAESACGWIALPVVWFGLTTTEGVAETHLLLDYGDGAVYDEAADPAGSFDGFIATHAWDLELYYVPIRIEGALTFPLDG